MLPFEKALVYFFSGIGAFTTLKFIYYTVTPEGNLAYLSVGLGMLALGGFFMRSFFFQVNSRHIIYIHAFH